MNKRVVTVAGLLPAPLPVAAGETRPTASVRTTLPEKTAAFVIMGAHVVARQQQPTASATTTRPAGSRSHTIPAGRCGVYSPTAVLIGFLSVFAGAGVVRSFNAADASLEPPRAVSTVNPNNAPWWELTVIPRIGPAIAMKIVHERQQFHTADLRGAGGREDQGRPAFQSAGDLDRVPGIGPVTLQRIAPYLHFDADGPSDQPG